jgi:signal transduction histidine kinase
MFRWIGFWTILGLGFTTQVYLAERRFGAEAPTWWVALVANLPEWYLWGLVSVLVVSLVRRFPVDRHGWRRHFPPHVGVSFNIAFLHLIAAVLIQSAVSADGSSVLSRLVDNFSVQYHWNVVVYWAILGVVHAREYHRDREAHRLRAARLEARLAQARLQALTLELRPHFLFNALNAIAELIHESPDAAEEMVQRLGRLLRRTLEADGAREVPLARELELADGYLRVEAIRFQDRLTVDVDVPAETRCATVPTMILLPLVENAVRHGVARRAGPGRVGIRARRAADRLELEIWDDGPGLGPELQREGIGLANTRARLANMYGPGSGLELAQREPTGLVVRVVLPFRAAA